MKRVPACLCYNSSIAQLSEKASIVGKIGYISIVLPLILRYMVKLNSTSKVENIMSINSPAGLHNPGIPLRSYVNLTYCIKIVMSRYIMC